MAGHPTYREGDPRAGEPILVGHNVTADGKHGTVIAVGQLLVCVQVSGDVEYDEDWHPTRIGSADPADAPETLTLTLTRSQWDAVVGADGDDWANLAYTETDALTDLVAAIEAARR